MDSNERVDEFLKLQEKGISLEEIASTLGVKPQTLRKDLNKSGYKSIKGKYVKNNSFEQVKFKETDIIATVEKPPSKNKSTKPKKDKKINITQEDLDKLCEVYDWYMEVKDLKSMKIKAKTNKKDIKIEDTNIDTLKSTSIKVDKKTWQDFERLCSNSKFTKQEIITQALKDFMKEYKNLL